MKDKFNPDNDGFDQSEEYFKKKGDKYENETEEYFPQETSKPCLLYTSPSPRDQRGSRMPSSA